MDGVVLTPSEFSITFVSPPSMTATHELVVPKSIPMTFAMTALSSLGRSFRPQRRRADPLKYGYLPEKPGQDRGYIGPIAPAAMDGTAKSAESAAIPGRRLGHPNVWTGPSFRCWANGPPARLWIPPPWPHAAAGRRAGSPGLVPARPFPPAR